MLMDPRFAEILREIEDASHQHGGMPKIARETGQFLNILAKAVKAADIVQIGALDGYLTLWMSEAAAINNGRITCIESDVWQYDSAKEVLDQSPYIDHVNLMQGDPVELLSVIEGPFDLVILDAGNGQALHYAQVCIEKVRSGALLCCNQVMSHATQLIDYLEYVHDTTGLESVLVPVGDGLEMTYKVP